MGHIQYRKSEGAGMSLHVECGIVRTVGSGITPVEVGDGLAWSETLDSAGTTANTAPDAPAGGSSAVVLTLTAEIDMWIAISASPMPGSTPRRRMKAGACRSFIAPGGVKVGWSPI
jgi:hypothetical protein